MPERILSLSKSLSDVATHKVAEIQKVTATTRILALNAQIEATRAGEAGRGFAVVAQEVKSISGRITDLADELTAQLKSKTDELSSLGQGLIANLRGRRLSDLALNMIDIIDRNLYERSCDVRWWATDAAVVECCAKPTSQASSFASQRLSVILGAYTVYLDLWIADPTGRIIANGRPDRYPRVIGSSVATEHWFRDAMATRDGNEFAVADISVNPLLDNHTVATYATAVRENGDANGKIIGALGVFFDWQTQSQTVVDAVRLEPDEKDRTRCLLLDSKFRIIAASDRRGVLTDHLPLHVEHRTYGNYVDNEGRTVGFALTPGYETYQGLGWYGVIMQDRQQ